MSTADDILDGKASKSAVDTILDGPPIAGAREQPLDPAQMSEAGLTPQSAMQLAKGIPAALPMAGEAIGSTVGSIAGPLGSGTGATLGREGGEYAQRALTGETDTRTLQQHALDAGTTFALNAGAPYALRAAGAGIRAGVSGLMRKGSTPAEIASALADATQFGVVPPITPVALNYSAKKVSEKIAAEASARVRALSERGVSGVASGAAIKLGAEQGANRFTDAAQALYGRFDELVPGNTSGTIENFRTTLRDLTTPTQGAEASTASLISPRARQFAAGLSEDININNPNATYAMVNGEPHALMPFEALRALRSKIGAELGAPQIGPDSIPYGALKQMYTALSSDMRIAAQRQGPEALEAFDRADNFYKDGIERLNTLVKPLVDGKIEQKVAAAITKSAKEGPQSITELRDQLSPAQWNIVAANVMQDLTSATKGTTQGMAQRFDFPGFVKKWEALPDDSKEALFGNMNGLRESLDTLSRVSKRIGDVAGVAQHSYSLLAHPLMFPALAAGGAAGGTLLGGGSVGSAAGAAGAAMLAMNTIPKAAGRLMTNPAVVRWLAQGTKVSPNGAGAWIGRLSAIAADADPGTRGAIQELLGNMQGGQ